MKDNVDGWSVCCAWFTRLLWASSCGDRYSVGLPYEREISQLRVASNQPVQAELQPSKTLERSWRCFNSWHKIFTRAMAPHHLSSSSWHPQAPCQSTNSCTSSIWNQNCFQLALRLAGSTLTNERWTKSCLFSIQSSFLRLVFACSVLLTGFILTEPVAIQASGVP